MRALQRLATGFERMPDTPDWFDRNFGSTPRQFLLLLAVGLVLRGSTFGDPNLHIDDGFYAFVADQMHHGAVPYVDVWDRKPVGLFLIYYLARTISPSPIAYQLAAWLSVSATALVISLISRRWAGAQGGVLAGVSYLFMLGIVEGYGGQSPVYYNLLISTAALLIVEAIPDLGRGKAGWPSYVSMALCGLALTVKQTALFEAIYFGLFAGWILWRSGAPPPRTTASMLVWMILGALPAITIALVYLASGHWPEFWQAMVTSNTARAHWPLTEIAVRALVMILRLFPLVALAILGLFITDRTAVTGRDRLFLLGWIGAATLGALAVPNFYTHYAQPLLVPLLVASSLTLGRRDIGVFLALLVAAFSLALYNPFAFADRRASAAAMARLARDIIDHDSGGGLFISDGPVYLYTMTGKRPLSPLAFPPHLNEFIERDVSQFNTHDEVRRILRRKPGVVILAVVARNPLTDGDTRNETMAYVTNNCRLIDVVTANEVGERAAIGVWGDCHDGAPDLDDFGATASKVSQS